MAGSDVMATYVLQLLQSQECEQREVLKSLSEYADLKNTRLNDVDTAMQDWGSTQPSPSLKSPGLAIVPPPGLDFRQGGDARSGDDGRTPGPCTVDASQIKKAESDLVALEQESTSSPLRIEAPSWTVPLQSRQVQCGQSPSAQLLASHAQPEHPKGSSGVTRGSGVGEQASDYQVKLLEKMQHLEDQQALSVQKLYKLMSTEQAMSDLVTAEDWNNGCQDWDSPSAACIADVAASQWDMDGQMAFGTTSYPLAVHNDWVHTSGIGQAPLLPGAIGAWSPPHSPQGGVMSITATAPRGGKFSGGPRHRLTGTAATDTPSANALAAQQAGETLRMHLQSLLDTDPGRVLLVRKINRLGFSSPDVLRAHYSWYGEVDRVLVAHSRVKSCTVEQKVYRLRPAGLGFVVMSRLEEARAVLDAGNEQMINGVLVRVQKFERRMSEQMSSYEEMDDPTPDTSSTEDTQSA
eukprot:CAMPEP_0115768050 /NCGR_PEP_ID=MMETSP0272-20121206/103987_1 /TAXON_ID=71861 /ORGANISM="Scrippsiella trochoidea, Strain CCMP3099" /LENGTH=463 /DNA_ID=CAMNT_0003214079 /DNA_START=79 /DNA_END=1471 /DNA_ORIENTATION=+